MSLNGRYIECPHFELQCAFSKHLITSILPILNGIIEYQTPYSSVISAISNISQKHWWSLLNVSLDYNIIKDQVFNHNLNKTSLISKLEIVGWSNRLCYLYIGENIWYSWPWAWEWKPMPFYISELFYLKTIETVSNQITKENNLMTSDDHCWWHWALDKVVGTCISFPFHLLDVLSELKHIW